MPKIIEDLETRLLTEAKRQIKELGYGAMTVRSVAKACGVGVAMGNAPDEIKAAADDVTDLNTNDGVAKAFEKYVL